MGKFKYTPSYFLRRDYVPAVYQPDIFAIDYQKLKDAGIKLISFDVDDTIADPSVLNPPQAAITLFAHLKNMGFELMLLPNSFDDRTKNFADKLGISGRCIPRAEKTKMTHFQTIQNRFGVEKSQVAHVGNSMMDDVARGNAFGITTCLVRRAGNAGALGKVIGGLLGVKTEGQQVREELKKRGIWRKHHKNAPGDQYYQLGELPLYQQTQDIAETAAADLTKKFQADKDTVFTPEEILQNIDQANESEGIQTLRSHLGDGIVFSGMWANARDDRYLAETELSDGEMSCHEFSISCYTIRITLCLYRDDDTVEHPQRVPAGPDTIAEYKKVRRTRPFGWNWNGFQEVQIISAKHKGASDWQKICMVTWSDRWQESIDFIGTLKYDATVSDEQELLFVLKQSAGDSYGVAYWYKLSSDGTMTGYREHPYNPESYKESWR